MPPVSVSGSRFRRTSAAVLIVLLGLGATVFINLGSYLAKEDVLAPADAIFVFAGSSMERPLEGADLYLAGYAPRLVLTYETPDQGMVMLRQRGIAYPARADLQQDALIRLGIPTAAILIPARIHDNTAQEAQTLRELAMANHWRRVICVSSKYHLRRAGFAARREMKGTDVQVLMRGSRYDLADPARWWIRRSDVRFVSSETTKLIAYALGLGA